MQATVGRAAAAMRIRRMVVLSALLFSAAANSSFFTSHSSFLSAQIETGYASFYAPRFTGKPTASGEKFHNDSLTCAHRSLPFGTMLRVVNLSNNRAVIVRVNDRGPFVRGRIVDLTRRAAQLLGFINLGMTKVSVQPVNMILPPLEITSSHTIPPIWKEDDVDILIEWPSIEPVLPLAP